MVIKSNFNTKIDQDTQSLESTSNVVVMPAGAAAKAITMGDVVDSGDALEVSVADAPAVKQEKHTGGLKVSSAVLVEKASEMKPAGGVKKVVKKAKSYRKQTELQSLDWPKPISYVRHFFNVQRLIHAQRHKVFARAAENNELRARQLLFRQSFTEMQQAIIFLMSMAGLHVMIAALIFAFGSADYLNLFMIYGSIIFGVFEAQALADVIRAENQGRKLLVETMQDEHMLKPEEASYVAYLKTYYHGFLGRLSNSALAAFVKRYRRRLGNNTILAYELNLLARERGLVLGEIYSTDYYDFKHTFDLNRAAFLDAAYQTLFLAYRVEAKKPDFVPQLTYQGEDAVLRDMLTADQQVGLVPWTLEQLTVLLQRCRQAVVEAGHGDLLNPLTAAVELGHGLKVVSELVDNLSCHQQKMQDVAAEEAKVKALEREAGYKAALVQLEDQLNRQLLSANKVLDQAIAIVGPVNEATVAEQEVTAEIIAPAKDARDVVASHDGIEALNPLVKRSEALPSPVVTEEGEAEIMVEPKVSEGPTVAENQQPGLFDALPAPSSAHEGVSQEEVAEELADSQDGLACEVAENVVSDPVEPVEASNDDDSSKDGGIRRAKQRDNVYALKQRRPQRIRSQKARRRAKKQARLKVAVKTGGPSAPLLDKPSAE